MRMIVFMSLSYLLLVGCSGGYQPTSYALSQSEDPIKTADFDQESLSHHTMHNIEE